MTLTARHHLAWDVLSETLCMFRTDLPRNRFKCAVDLVSPIHEHMIEISILACHCNHLFLRLEGHVCYFAQLFGVVHTRLVSLTGLKGLFSPALKDVHRMMQKSKKRPRPIAPAHYVTTIYFLTIAFWKLVPGAQRSARSKHTWSVIMSTCFDESPSPATGKICTVLV